MAIEKLYNRKLLGSEILKKFTILHLVIHYLEDIYLEKKKSEKPISNHLQLHSAQTAHRLIA